MRLSIINVLFLFVIVLRELKLLNGIRGSWEVRKRHLQSSYARSSGRGLALEFVDSADSYSGPDRGAAHKASRNKTVFHSASVVVIADNGAGYCLLQQSEARNCCLRTLRLRFDILSSFPHSFPSCVVSNLFGLLVFGMYGSLHGLIAVCMLLSVSVAVCRCRCLPLFLCFSVPLSLSLSPVGLETAVLRWTIRRWRRQELYRRHPLHQHRDRHTEMQRHSHNGRSNHKPLSLKRQRY